MKKLILLVFLIPQLSKGQVVPLVGGPYERVDGRLFDAKRAAKGVLTLLDAQTPPLPTGKYRTVKGSFTTIYSPKMRKGWVFEREMEMGGIPYWEPVGYSRRKFLLFRRKYGLWEIYFPAYKR